MGKETGIVDNGLTVWWMDEEENGVGTVDEIFSGAEGKDWETH